MALPSKTFQQFTSDIVAQWAAQIGFNPSLQPGDALYATMQSVASQMVFLQALAQLVNAVGRVSTCGMVNGVQVTPSADVDTFMAQFGFVRLPAVSAGGTVSFQTNLASTPTTVQILITPGVIVQTVGGAIQYQVIADASQAQWSPTLNAYVINPGQSTCQATVQALVPGSGSNVTAGTLTQIASPLPGISFVTNVFGFSNGKNAETDDAFRSRFISYINSLSKATQSAIANAITNVGQGIVFRLIENVDGTGTAALGQFLVVVDDGSGSPPASLVTAVLAAVNAVRGFTIQAHAIAVVIQAVVISIVIHTDPLYVQATVNTAVQNAIVAGVNATPIGGGTDGFLRVSEVESFALAVAGVISVRAGATGTTINGSVADLAILPLKAARSPVVTVTNY